MLAASLNLVKKINALITTAKIKEIDAVELKGFKVLCTINLIIYLYTCYIEYSMVNCLLLFISLKHSCNAGKIRSHHNVIFSNMLKCIPIP